MAILLIRFRSAKLRKLAESAVSQGFTQKVTGSNHLGIICPTCGELTIFSGSQQDRSPRRFQNQQSRLRNHGMHIAGKADKECTNVGSRRQVA